jgi:Cd2+/Zn2+-exporting ATPase
MMTGDSAAAAAAVAAAMGIPAADTHSNLLPEDKLQLLQQYKRQYKAVAHVGDGINDAPALANADVGIAMGVAGSALAVEAADVALFSNDLSNVPFAVGLGRRVAWVVTSNIVLAVVVKVAVAGPGLCWPHHAVDVCAGRRGQRAAGHAAWADCAAVPGQQGA